ncbi:hypothetical protein M2451_000325 [Dysgonomonas sp. PFB1-18]|uniref:hypothetical protein n=1 Tax=unclassified Dysgonomonas TaxID=2630389 RepID=UPI0024739784|nr:MULTISPECIES: hypothetical protein [unclassified Dysgonomonas]MDH6307876.1 hypothetical protein [Dysgonomonas sp. PF1-14]MDH6337794.1 hypothetical protein [Dysgonomonas sp. PF1-16]MDH6379018.1 hypothetical protein [Dysgonomonas sp. PFB1-18]MDH6396653.1 hypothetical protein [Dysgonomonas sp. PF1-23]
MKINKEGRMVLELEENTMEEELYLIEKGLNIKFEGNELSDTHTFDDLTNLIISKIQLENDSVCTSSRMFYKLKRFISATSTFDVKQLTPDTKLKDIFPSKKRKRRVKALEHYLGFKLDLLAPNHILLIFLRALFIVGVLNLFSSVIVGLIAMTLAALGFYLAFAFGKTLCYDTVRNLIEDQVLYNYLKMREGEQTVNRKEIENLLNKHYCGIMCVDKSELSQIRF